MKTILVIFVAFASLLLLVTAAPAEGPGVQFLKYSNDQELEELQKQIIAQYESLGGTSQFHQIQSASVVDPATLKINI
ncbi:uncharacterized protein LOC105665068 [Ceratitis capitata]|uniref:(Mediterranean fruit fly) hypothetical protein n=1 Tax=Ceratitis capitata TaxID=7213 RepID=A0A811U305_CERCA|nr:uncharacterized protein LOC105665068 [Ceratitis capitata]CAD6993512.1 unnamed protein product [Ceratitis capitata]